MRIAEALADQEERVDTLIKAGGRYLAQLKAWKKASQTGDLGKRQRAAAAAEDLARQLEGPTAEAARAWDFDARAYLEGDAWRQELREACRAAGMRVFEEEDLLVSPPVLVRAQPGLTRLLIGKTAWPTLQPRLTSEHLKKLNERSTSTAAAQQFLNALYAGSKRISKQGDDFTRFKDLYDLFSFAPGWSRENTRTSFAQQIYALHRSDARTTRDNKMYEIEYPTGKVRESDVFSVISEDGRPIRYYGIWFR